MRMAAIYARVSSEQQREENTIASQTAALIQFAQDHDLEVPKEWVFEDEGYSGATLERPGLEHVRDLAAEGQIQVVLAYTPDRLSRFCSLTRPELILWFAWRSTSDLAAE